MARSSKNETICSGRNDLAKPSISSISIESNSTTGRQQQQTVNRVSIEENVTASKNTLNNHIARNKSVSRAESKILEDVCENSHQNRFDCRKCLRCKVRGCVVVAVCIPLCLLVAILAVILVYQMNTCKENVNQGRQGKRSSSLWHYFFLLKHILFLIFCKLYVRKAVLCSLFTCLFVFFFLPTLSTGNVASVRTDIGLSESTNTVSTTASQHPSMTVRDPGIALNSKVTM